MNGSFSNFHRLVRVGAVCLVLLGVAGLAQAQNYWFETYERAVELIDDNRLDRAEELLGQVIEDRPVPQSAIRVPGNRYIHYLPYFQRARIQIERGQFDLAAHNLDVSEAFGAIRFNRRRLAQFQKLREVARAEMAGPATAMDETTTLTVEKNGSRD
jgi:hypothetical protein